ncbi:Hypp8392 [Branchiostoma lanceolatum]|uniref:Hypp8392 protein n=1 Tax=Branchiostoma lanceolatum TaxID=7740 RepID=A0A8J9Z8H9_BRALA|nr:Hypp8392 [Branchiostoma lanceolatum]
MECEDAPALKFQIYHRPGAPMAGIMTYASIDDKWIEVGWVPKKKKVLEMCGGRPERLRVTLKEAYMKCGNSVIKVEAALAED